MVKEERIALVTGANKGIGFEICRQLAKEGLKVILTARSEEKGLHAVQQLKNENIIVAFHGLDVTEETTIRHCSDYISKEFGRLDILINNAGITSDHNGMIETEPEVFRKVMDTNYYGPLRITRALFPYLNRSDDARVINVSSRMGCLEELKGDYAAYRLSKASLNALTIMFANEFKTHGIKVNAIHPGWVKTELGGPNAPRTLAEGADTAVWLATAKNSSTGCFFSDRKKISW